MATIDRPTPTGGARRTAAVLDAEIAASIDGEPTYPDGTAFVPRDLADPFLLEGYRRSRTPVAIISEDGSVELVRPRWLGPEELRLGVLIAALAIVFLLIRRRVSA